MRLEGTDGVGLSAARLPVISECGRTCMLAGKGSWCGGGFGVASWACVNVLRVGFGAGTGVGLWCPTECPTTRFGRTSSGGRWGRQLLEATPHASRRACVWALMGWAACLCVCALGQSAKQRPLSSHERQASLEPNLGSVTAVSGEWASIMALMDAKAPASQRFLMAAL